MEQWNIGVMGLGPQTDLCGTHSSNFPSFLHSAVRPREASFLKVWFRRLAQDGPRAPRPEASA
jgi:hypothetical protein